MCRTGHGSSRDLFTGGHIGPPLRNDGRRSETNGNWRGKRTLLTGRDGARPLRGTGAGRCVQDGGVRSPRPTGATLVVRSSGPMYLRHGFRRPNFVPKFGASVMGIGPYEKESKPH